MEIFIMRRIAVVLLAMFAFAGMAAPGSTQDLGCPQFSSAQESAQEYFEANGGSTTTNFNDMDANNNGIACDEPGAFQGGGPSAGPEDGPTAHPTECSEFDDQASAQEFLDNAGDRYDDIENIDQDQNGIACDEPGIFAGSGPSAGPESCADFATQEEAQTAFENGGGTSGDDALNLDPDGNGIACDDAADDEGPTAHPTECGEFADQASAQEFLDNAGDRYDDIDKIDLDGNGIACDEPGDDAAPAGDEGTSGGDNTQADDDTVDTDESDTVADTLPSTGSGSASGMQHVTHAPIAGAMTILLLGMAMIIRRIERALS